MNTDIDLITMGCSKNLVDSEELLNQFAAQGFTAHHNPEKTHGGIAIVNTCGFIADAKEESINMILSLCELKEAGKLQKVLVMGCLSQRYMDELKAEIPQVDKYYGKFDWHTILDDLKAAYDPKLPHNTVRTTPPHYAYIKIAEGCNRHCAYCAIPIITGPHRSRTPEDILEEVRTLAANGVREFQIMEQELTYYGIDLCGKPLIADLIERMAKIEGVEWIRLHYAYPNGFPLDLLRVIRENDNVCKYLDIALQHISDSVLTRMRRHVSKAETLELIDTIRREVPGICLRTTLMVGFPGETNTDFEELLDFVCTARFERLGAFAYCEEEDTYAARHYTDDVPENVKAERIDRLMALQEEISAEVQAARVGQTLRVIIDRKEGEFYVGRTQYDSPEVDGEVLIPENAKLEIGRFYDIHIDKADSYDLYGTPIVNTTHNEQ